MKCALVVVWLLLAGKPGRADEYADLFRKAAVHTQNRQYEQAILDYKGTLAIRPGAPEVLNNLAVISYQLHRYADAFGFASKIWKTHPELKSAALVTGMAAVQCNRPKDAIPPLQALLASEPANRDALVALASAFFALNDLAEAIRIYEREVILSPKDSIAWYGLAVCYERSAENCSSKLAHMPGGRSYSKLMLAQYLQGAGDDKLAAEAFGNFETDDAAASPQAKDEYELARSFAKKSQGAFEHLVEVAPDSWQTAVFFGDVARQHGDLRSALAHYNDALTKQPNNPAPLLGLGTVYWELGEFDRATSYLRQTLKLNPRAMQAFFELGNIAVRRHKETDAIPLLRQYLAVQPDALAARADLGRAYLRLGDYEDAAAELSKAAASDERGEINYQLSLALKKLGRMSEADVALKQSSVLRKAQLEREQRRHAQ